MAEPRKSSVDVSYNGLNISTTLESYLKSFSYTDPASGESDSISIKVHDKEKKWINNWLPSKGDQLSASIITENWNKDGEIRKFDCGSFTIDELGAAGRPMEATIGAVSVPVSEGFSVTEKTTTWEEVTIETIASDIAVRAGISLYYEASTIKISSIEQSNENDCSFLYKLCSKYGLAMKVYKSRIIIFEESVYEKKSAVVTIDEADMKSWNYSDSMVGTYTGVNITYTDPYSGDDISVVLGSGNRIYNSNTMVDNYEEAELIGTAAVNNANKSAVSMKIVIAANKAISSSTNVNITGLGKLNGKYAVDKVTHNLSNGYTMTLQIRKIQSRLSANAMTQSSVQKYSVNGADTLELISQRFYGSIAYADMIYNANSILLDGVAMTFGKENSNNGLYLYPGTVLTIPDIE